MSKTTSRFGYKYPEGSENVSAFPALQGEAMKQVDETNLGQSDYLQAGVVTSESFSFVAEIKSSNGELRSAAEVPESVAWLPDPVVSGALMRTVSPKASLAYRALSTGSLPAAGKFSSIAFEVAPKSTSGWNAEAVVTTKAGTEQSSQALAEASPPATSSGKIQVRRVVVKNTAGVYSIEAQEDVRPFAGKSWYGAWLAAESVAFTGSNLYGRLEQGGAVTRLRGVVYGGANQSGGTRLFTLPAALRPEREQIIDAAWSQKNPSASGNADKTPCLLTVGTNGEVVYYGEGLGGLEGKWTIYLDGKTFPKT